MKFNSKSIIISFSAFHCLDELEGDFFDAAYWYCLIKVNNEISIIQICVEFIRSFLHVHQTRLQKYATLSLIILWLNRVAGKKRLLVPPKQTITGCPFFVDGDTGTRPGSHQMWAIILYFSGHHTVERIQCQCGGEGPPQVRGHANCGVHSTVYVVAIYTFCFWRPNDSMTFNTIPRAVKIFWRFCLMFKYKKQTIWSIVCTSSTSSVTKSDLPHHMWYTLWLNAASTHLFSLIRTVHKHLP